MKNISVNFCGIKLKNPIITASGTYGFGREYNEYFSPSDIGAVCVKGLTLKERTGNPPPRIAETWGGILNSVGLQNPGVHTFIKNELDWLKKTGAVVIANIAGNTVDEYCEMVKILSDTDTDLLEINISCPNVKEGGVAFGTNCDTVYNITSRVKEVSKKPIIIKLSPNVTDITAIAHSAEKGGADALSLINTILGMKIDINTRKPVLYNNMGGLSGRAVLPVAVRMIHQVRQATKLPIIGMGGVTEYEDAVEIMLAGANTVAVGTAMFNNPNACMDILNGLESYMNRNGINDINDISGKVILN